MNNYLVWCHNAFGYFVAAVIVFFSSHGGYAQTTSVLNSGNWYKYSTHSDGVHRLGYEDLLSFGVLSEPVVSDHIQLYSNGPGMLPEQNWVERPFDLQQIAIAIHDQGDGIFGAGDYLLFYGTGQTQWKYNANTNRYAHTPHLYDDGTHYFLTIGEQAGERVAEAVIPSDPAVETISTFTDCVVHEVDIVNIHHSGKKWFGEAFSAESELTFELETPDIVPNTVAKCVVDVASRCTGANNTNTFEVSVGPQNSSFEVLNVSNNYLNEYVRQQSHTTEFTASTSPVTINLGFVPHNQYSFAYLNYVTLEFIREIKIPASEQLNFSILAFADSSNNRLISVDAATSNHQVWEVTNFFRPTLVPGLLNSGKIEFSATQDIERKYAAFNPSNAPTPEFIGIVPNQNLKGAPPAAGFIVVHPDFLPQAQQLADFHESHNGLSVNVATTEEVYNEFSGGTKDVTAIKDYLRYFYNSAPSEAERPKYLCLFGDASIDYKGNLYPNTDFVPTFQSEKSFAQITSYCSDDYFVLLDSLDSNQLTDKVDVATGRLPAKTMAEAQILVDKIIDYHQPSGNGEWQQHMIFVADDEDNNIHMSQSNQLATQIEAAHCDIYTERVFFDAFEQVDYGNGDRYPGATAHILNRLEEGVIVCNYTGHSGYSNWAAEIVMIDTLFAGLQNAPHLPLFFMANCEFSRFDRPSHISGSEILMLNASGGSIACVSNSRPGYSSSNYTFNHHFNSNLFGFLENGERPRLGDLIRYAKNNSTTANGMAHRSNNLLGDPMMRLSYPDLGISISDVQGAQQIDDQWVFGFDETIDISGNINTLEGVASSFNGTLRFLILDSPTTTLTLGNDAFQPFPQTTQNDTIAWGTTTVENGVFSFSAHIAQNGNGETGQGKIMLYASTDALSAMGCYTDFVIESTTVSLNQEKSLQFVAYPNPAQSVLSIQSAENVMLDRVVLFNTSGKSVSELSPLQPGNANLNIENLAPGTYLLRVESGNQVGAMRVVKLPH